MININNISRAYSEVYEFINIIGDDYINEIPAKIYNVIENNREKEYNPKIKTVDEMLEYEFSTEALALIAALNLQYWCKDKNIKEKYINEYNQNEQKEERLLNEKYSYENLFKNRSKLNIEHDEEKSQETKELVVYKENILRKIFQKIKKIFNK